MIDRAFMTKIEQQLADKRMADTYSVSDVGVYTQEFPYPCYYRRE